LPSTKGQNSSGDPGYQDYLPEIPGQDRAIPPEIPSSFGIDFVEVTLDHSLDGQQLTLAFSVPLGSPARFRVQILQLKESSGDGQPHLISEGGLPSGPFLADGAAEEVVFRIPALHAASFDRLALIIVRLDPFEQAYPVGAYRIVLQP
jgi:hypothetical protein